MLQSLPNPVYNRYGNRVSYAPVSLGIRESYIGVSPGISLKLFTFFGGESPILCLVEYLGHDSPPAAGVDAGGYTPGV